MKKNLTKLLALMMALALVFSLAACGGDNGDENSTDPSNNPAANESVDNDDTVPPAENTDPSATNEDPSAEESDTQTPGETEKPGETQKPGEPQKPDAPTAQKAPQGVNEIVKAYNAGIVTMKSASMKRTLDAGRVYKKDEIPVVGKIDLNLGNEQGVKDAFSNNNTATQISDKKLYKLKEADVSSATCQESGNNYVFTINLKSKKLDVNSAKHGDGGYSYFIDKAEAGTVVGSMLKAFNLPGSATINGGSVTLSKGVIKATVNKSTGKILKVDYSFTESVVADATYKILISVAIDEATIAGHGTVNYSA